MSLAEGASDTEHNKQEEEPKNSQHTPTGTKKKINDKGRQVSYIFVLKAFLLSIFYRKGCEILFKIV